MTFLLVGAAVSGAVGLTGCSDDRRLTSPTGPEEQGAESPVGGDARLEVLEGLGGSFTIPRKINGSGEVAGTAETADGAAHAFLWSEGRMRDLGTLGGSWSTAADLNDWGQVTGTTVTASGEARAFFWAGGTLHDLGTLGGRESHGVAVNDRGEVAGYSTTADGEVHAFLWSRGRMRDLGTLGGSRSFTLAANDRGDVVGRSGTRTGRTRAFRWSDDGMSELTPDHRESSSAVDVSERGAVIVNAGAGHESRAYLWAGGTLSPLTAPEPGGAVASDVNAGGTVVGQIAPDSGPTQAVMWRNGGVLRLHEASMGASSAATAVSDAGTVTGALRAGSASGSRAFWWSQGEGVRLLEPRRLGSAARNTAGMDVTETGLVVGLVTYDSGRAGTFLWLPGADPDPGESRGDGRGFRSSVTAGRAPSRDPGVASGARPRSVADRADPLPGRWLEGVLGDHPELSLPPGVAALMVGG